MGSGLVGGLGSDGVRKGNGRTEGGTPRGVSERRGLDGSGKVVLCGDGWPRGAGWGGSPHLPGSLRCGRAGELRAQVCAWHRGITLGVWFEKGSSRTKLRA